MGLRAVAPLRDAERTFVRPLNQRAGRGCRGSMIKEVYRQTNTHVSSMPMANPRPQSRIPRNAPRYCKT